MTLQPGARPLPNYLDYELVRKLGPARSARSGTPSDARRIINRPAFRQIVALGKEVAPSLLRDLQARPSPWVWALPEITGKDPVPPAEAEIFTR